MALRPQIPPVDGLSQLAHGPTGPVPAALAGGAVLRQPDGRVEIERGIVAGDGRELRTSLEYVEHGDEFVSRCHRGISPGFTGTGQRT